MLCVYVCVCVCVSVCVWVCFQKKNLVSDSLTFTHTADNIFSLENFEFPVENNIVFLWNEVWLKLKKEFHSRVFLKIGILIKSEKKLDKKKF